MKGMRRGLSVAVSAALCAALWGCDSRPSGPGDLTASLVVDGSAPGAALLLLSGSGLVGAEGSGGTLVWSSPPTAEMDELRVLVVEPELAGAATFRIQVRERAASIPSITVLQLADHDNVRFTTEDIQVRIQR